MRKRRRVYRGRRNNRVFRNTVRKVHKKNLSRRVPRGGYHL